MKILLLPALAMLLAVGLISCGSNQAELDSANAKVASLESELSTANEKVLRLSQHTASGGGANVKMMPDEAGNPTVPMDEVFGFGTNYAFCRVDNVPVGFVMPTYAMGEVFVEPNTFFMLMKATDIASFEISTLSDGETQAVMEGDFDCATEAGVAGTKIGGREAFEPASFEVIAIDGGAGNANDSFVFRAFFDEDEAPINHAIFGPEFDFTGDMVSGDITIVDPDA